MKTAKQIKRKRQRRRARINRRRRAREKKKQIEDTISIQKQTKKNLENQAKQAQKYVNSVDKAYASNITAIARLSREKL